MTDPQFPSRRSVHASKAPAWTVSSGDLTASPPERAAEPFAITAETAAVESPQPQPAGTLARRSRPAPEQASAMPARRRDVHRHSKELVPSPVEGKALEPHREVRRGRRAAGQEVKLPWWANWWQPLVIAVVMCGVGVGALFGAHAYWQSHLPPVLVAEGTMDEVVVTGRQGAAPVLELLSPLKADRVQVREQFRGSGRTVEPDTPVLLSISAFDGQTGSNLQPHGLPTLLMDNANEDSLGATLADVVVGSTEGSRFVVGRRLADGSTEVDVVDILYTIAKGTPAADTSGPLTVELTEAGPVISHAGSEPPGDLSVQVLLEGDGPQVQEGDQVVAQYLAVNWTSGTQIASTWDLGTPRLVELADAMPGLREALVDRRVGTRLAIVIPPEKATGEDTLCVVVDILGTMPGIGTDSGTD